MCIFIFPKETVKNFHFLVVKRSGEYSVLLKTSFGTSRFLNSLRIHVPLKESRNRDNKNM